MPWPSAFGVQGVSLNPAGIAQTGFHGLTVWPRCCKSTRRAGPEHMYSEGPIDLYRIYRMCVYKYI